MLVCSCAIEQIYIILNSVVAHIRNHTAPRRLILVSNTNFTLQINQIKTDKYYTLALQCDCLQLFFTLNFYSTEWFSVVDPTTDPVRPIHIIR